MKQKAVILITSFAIVTTLGFISVVNNNGIAGRTGSPGETKCNSCHGNAGTGSVSIGLPAALQGGASYVPGQAYTMSVTVSQSGCNLFGFGFEALQSSGANAGTLTPGTGVLAKNATISGNSRKSMVHALNGGATANTHTFSFTWTAPATSVGNVTLYTAGVAANGDNTDNSADKTYTTSLVIPAPTAVSLEETNELVSGFRVMPNPAKEEATLSFSLKENGKVRAELYDLQGKAIGLFDSQLQAGTHTRKIDIAGYNLSNGLYFIYLTLENGQKISSKLIVNR